MLVFPSGRLLKPFVQNEQTFNEDNTLNLHVIPPRYCRSILLWPVGFRPHMSYGSYFFSVDQFEVGQLSTVTCQQMVLCHLGRCRILICVRLGLRLAFHKPKRNLLVEV